ncbi:MAG: hypothetical protein KA354_11355 [Phycisphaerae bacterium]|nr:hypothetical protein [Phycisphaerae bacterium]
MWRDTALRPGTAPPPLAESRFLFNRQRQSTALEPPVKPSWPFPNPLAKPYPLATDLAKGDYLVLVRNPEGNMIELIGPLS